MKNADGFIDQQEIKLHLSRYQDELNDSLIMDMIKEVDLNQDGKVASLLD